MRQGFRSLPELPSRRGARARILAVRGGLLCLLLAAGCRITQPEQCNPAKTNTVTLVTVRDGAGLELARGSVIVQSVDGDSIPAWFVLSVYSESGMSPLMGHVLTARLVDERDALVHEALLVRGASYTAYSAMPLRDTAYATHLRERLQYGTLTLELTTDIATLPVLRSPVAYNAGASGVIPAFCFPACRMFCD